MESESKLELIFNPSGPDCSGDLSASYGGTGIYTTRIQITDAKQREEFISIICEKRAGIGAANVRAELETLAANAVKNANRISRERFTQADILLKLAESAELFVDDDIEYAAIPVKLPKFHQETHRIRDKQFKKWLLAMYYRQSGRAASASSMQDAIETLCGKASNCGVLKKTAVRIGELNGNVYLDLANSQWQAVEITPNGCRIVSDPPIRFLRKPGMQEIPAPIPGGNLAELRPLINAGDDETWQLIIGWLIGAMNPAGPYPILAVNGEQGSAKSTLCRMLRQIIDPNLPDLRSAPRNERDLFISAGNSWIIAFDNLSAIRADMSDGICRLATGGGYSTRELYADDAERLFNACRPQMFNGIEEVATKPDLLERCIVIQLPAIPDENRRTESELSAEFERIRPRLLGAICDAVVMALREQANVRLPKYPRLADFAKWVCAAEPALGWPAMTFFDAYENNRGSANAVALESSPLAELLLKFMDKRDWWRGSATELMVALQTDELADPKSWDRRGLPKTARAISSMIDRIAPILRRCGITINKGEKEGRNRKRIIRIERAVKTSSAPSASVPIADSGTQAAKPADAESLYASSNRPPDRPQYASKSADTDSADDADGMKLAESAYSGGY